MIHLANPDISEEAKARVEEVLDSGMIADGPEVRTFEDEFSGRCSAEHGVATSNGTTALKTALHALGIGEGDRVLTTPFSFVASANAIRHTGADPVFADIDSHTFNLDVESARSAVEDTSIDAILIVHLYGLPAAMDEFQDLAEELEVPLIEDAAQAHGAMYNDQPVGSFGDVACFSFYPTKNMTTGEGGMIVTDRADIATAARSHINHGRTRNGGSYTHAEVGHNHRMTSVAAVIGQEQLDRLSELNQVRRANAEQLSDGLADTGLTTPVEPDDARHVYHQYTVRVDDRDALQQHLNDVGIDTGVYYPVCVHEQPVYSDITHTAPAAEQASQEVLSLPVHSGLSENDIDRIVTEVIDYGRE
ncbi:DegT/DnrJ/EryC1/StrS family aminotransferase [Halobacterium salinarum]|uniref:DegT/DnrJ/EryC1/StrS family aminotransferase n=1 Tax=Halobacterium salinarum TaxID=2242 RepID=UPI002557B319|nr:DegT/DnrJ/EryC1/StrS family aminotransferase [Halobacterium salinarum]MDL0125106.1 DegT/DnrJ/EryC1/StrS family aminotransferase [Halobacterium salinarum]